jgi:hypothetical protein
MIFAFVRPSDAAQFDFEFIDKIVSVSINSVNHESYRRLDKGLGWDRFKSSQANQPNQVQADDTEKKAEWGSRTEDDAGGDGAPPEREDRGVSQYVPGRRSMCC